MEGDNNYNNSDMYKECLRNHAASLGSYATDGCGEFTPDDTYPGGVGGLNCAACGYHRNFHRKVSQAHKPADDNVMMDYGGRQITASMAYSPPESSDRSSKKRFRTKFSEEQKEKMMGFAERLGWKMQRKDLDDEIERFCRGVGISRKVFKVWMHNHKNNNSSNAAAASNGNASSLTDDQ